MKRHSPRSVKSAARGAARPPRGFTLIEMLISVTLILLMMTLFASIFQLASGAVTKHRSIGENDQKARSLEIPIRSDLSRRTFRYMQPFDNGEDLTSNVNIGKVRDGYFYVSENDPNDDTDDVLQFTVNARLDAIKERRDEQYLGRARHLNNSAIFNQLSEDDGDVNNDLSMSRYAEVTYFLRRGTLNKPGTLYRRVLMIRDPGLLGTVDSQPSYESGGTRLPLFGQENVATPSPDRYYPKDFWANPGGSAPNQATNDPLNFWNEFDFAAVSSALPFAATPVRYGATITHGGMLAPGAQSIGMPSQRFGFRHLDTDGATPAHVGRPKEYLFDAGAASTHPFIGRYTVEETSHVDFRYPMDPYYPQNAAANSGRHLFGPNIGNASGLTYNYDEGVVEEFRKTRADQRRGDDILMSNVLSFDVKLWDDATAGYVNIGGAESVSYPPASADPDSRRLNTLYGPHVANTSLNNVFDTWHPAFRFYGGSADNASPPLLPSKWLWTGTLTNEGPIRTGVRRPMWAPNQVYQVGDIVFGRPAPSGMPLTQPPPDQSVFYRCVAVNGSATSSAGPASPMSPNPAAGAQMDGTATDNVYWLAEDNRRPVRSISITIRFQNESNGDIRTMTLIHQLND